MTLGSEISLAKFDRKWTKRVNEEGVCNFENITTSDVQVAAGQILWTTFTIFGSEMPVTKFDNYWAEILEEKAVRNFEENGHYWPWGDHWSKQVNHYRWVSGQASFCPHLAEIGECIFKILHFFQRLPEERNKEDAYSVMHGWFNYVKLF